LRGRCNSPHRFSLRTPFWSSRSRRSIMYVPPGGRERPLVRLPVCLGTVHRPQCPPVADQGEDFRSRPLEAHHLSGPGLSRIHPAAGCRVTRPCLPANRGRPASPGYRRRRNPGLFPGRRVFPRPRTSGVPRGYGNFEVDHRVLVRPREKGCRVPGEILVEGVFIRYQRSDRIAGTPSAPACLLPRGDRRPRIAAMMTASSEPMSIPSSRALVDVMPRSRPFFKASSSSRRSSGRYPARYAAICPASPGSDFASSDLDTGRSVRPFSSTP